MSTGSLGRGRLAATCLGVAVLTLAVPAAASAPATSGAPRATAAPAPLSNVAHLDFLYDTVHNPPAQEGHSTYQLDQDPSFGVVWVYAHDTGGGTYQRIGGGAYDAATNTWGQGSYDTDDITRCAIAYLRHWQIFGDTHSRDRAYELLRGTAYFQVLSGPHAGNFEIWMQPDGTINRHSVPFDGNADTENYSLARAIWAFGEGYEAFKQADPAFAQFLQDRLALSMDALERQGLSNYGEYHMLDGLRWPSWFMGKYSVNATSDMSQGLIAYIRSTAGATDPATKQLHDRAAAILTKEAEGINQMALGDAYRWPFGAMLNTSSYREYWTGWGNMMPGVLAEAGALLGHDDWIATAVASVARFAPHLLVQGGADLYWAPTPVNRIQVGFAVDDLVQDLYKVGVYGHRPGLRELAGFAASWYFGNNYAHRQMYNPDNGVLFDGLTADGYVNTDSGAETAHAVMSMELLDQNPDLAARARAFTMIDRQTWQFVEAESGSLSGAATVSDPCAFIGTEGQCSGRTVDLGPGGHDRLSVDLPTGKYRLLVAATREPVAPGQLGASLVANGRPVETVDFGGAGDQGISRLPGYLDIATADATIQSPDEAHVDLDVGYSGNGAEPLVLDGVFFQPVVELQSIGDASSAQTLLRSFSTHTEQQVVTLPASGLVAQEYDQDGNLVRTVTAAGSTITAPVAPGGFTLVSSRDLATA